MRPLFGVWKIIFTRSTAIWKKREKKVKKFQSGIFGLFLTAMASRLSGIASTNISRHPSKKNPKNIENGGMRRLKKFAVPCVLLNLDGPLWGPLGLAHPLRLRGVKSADFYPPNSRFQYFFGFFWLGCLEILVLAMLESLEAIAVKKSLKMPLWIFFTEIWFHRSSN